MKWKTPLAKSDIAPEDVPMREWFSTYAFFLWLLGGAVFGLINPALGGVFMLGTYLIFTICELMKRKK